MQKIGKFIVGSQYIVNIRQCFPHYYKLGDNESEAKQKICPDIDKNGFSTKTEYRWFERLRNREFSLEDDQKSGCLTKIDLSELMRVIESDHILTTREVATSLWLPMAIYIINLNRFVWFLS